VGHKCGSNCTEDVGGGSWNPIWKLTKAKKRLGCGKHISSKNETLSSNTSTAEKQKKVAGWTGAIVLLFGTYKCNPLITVVQADASSIFCRRDYYEQVLSLGNFLCPNDDWTHSSTELTGH
jgi:hypothetical protein